MAWPTTGEWIVACVGVAQVGTAGLIVRLTSRLTNATRQYADHTQKLVEATTREVAWNETAFVRQATARILAALEPVSLAIDTIDGVEIEGHRIAVEEAIKSFWFRVLSDLYVLPVDVGLRVRTFKRNAELALSQLSEHNAQTMVFIRTCLIGLLGILRLELSCLARGEELPQDTGLPQTVEELDEFIKTAPPFQTYR